MGLRSVSVSYLEDNRTGFFFDVIKKILRRIQYVDKEVSGLFLLYAIRHGEGDIAADYLGEVLSMNLEDVRIAGKSNCVLPPDPGDGLVSYLMFAFATAGSKHTYHY